MKKLKLLSITLTLCALAAFTVFPVSALESDDTGLEDALEVEIVEDSVPESAGEILDSPEISSSGEYGGALRQIWDFVKEHGGQTVKNVMRSAVLILFITILCSGGGFCTEQTRLHRDRRGGGNISNNRDGYGVFYVSWGYGAL